ncbi:tail fiber domain-containing protein [Halobacteria archaeon AArc-curdl1]|uniref:Tail fiber domain-containing protein n=1 Tax=Natronosalvus hydrolyticus TaxID=2979988 RepID=A0AAP2Z8I1_9EURY|nr:tail fiber domain-containing protein [Halobacteria archaeon AArc-curdl1]
MANNHDYNTPEQGAQDWHVPLNDNFERLDVDVELRDIADNREDYEAKDGAKFLETDTGIVYEGDGSSWEPILAMGTFDEDGTLQLEGFDGSVTISSYTFETDDMTRSVGNGAMAIHQGAIVLADSKNTQFLSKGPDEVRSQMPIYAPAFNTTSARAAKTAIEPVDTEATLAGVESLEINSWTFTDADTGRHVGPMAEDFQDAFDLEGDDGSIATVDADGVAFAAIQGLSERIEDLRDQRAADGVRIETLEAENETLRARLAALEERLDSLEARDEPSTKVDD